MTKPARLILASGSAARQKMLRDAGLSFEAIPADIDEGAEQSGPAERALNLAIAKARAVSSQNPEVLVIGSDQTLTCEGRFFEKAQTPEAAMEKLRALRGKTHELVSAVSVVRDGAVIFEAQQKSDMIMRDFDDDFLARYCAAAGDALTQCVGAYALEAEGIWLFADIDGDYHTILGMPLLPLLGFLGTRGFGP